jgi:hypothetical protein
LTGGGGAHEGFFLVFRIPAVGLPSAPLVMVSGLESGGDGVGWFWEGWGLEAWGNWRWVWVWLGCGSSDGCRARGDVRGR